METGGGLFDEQPEIQAGEVSMGPDVSSAEKQTAEQMQTDKGIACSSGTKHICKRNTCTYMLTYVRACTGQEM